MKKSDAVHIINEVIQNGNARSSYELAAQALEKLLEAGMKPPSYIGDSECIGSQVENEWESE